MNMHIKTIDDCVEQICTKGCHTVRHDMKLLEQSIAIPETQGLTQNEIKKVLNELQEVMAAYSGSCPIPSY